MDNGNTKDISPQDRLELNNIQQTAHEWRQALLSSVGPGTSGQFDFNAYRNAMEFYRNQATRFLERYPNDPWITTMLSQAEAWLKD